MSAKVKPIVNNLISIQLKGGRKLECVGEASGLSLAKKLKKELSGPPLALEVNGRLCDLNYRLQNGDNVAVICFSDEIGKRIFWHSSAHLLAQAVLRLFPQAKPTIGPAIEEGFFYDFGDLELDQEDLQKIEAEAHKIIKQNLSPERIEFTSEDEAKQVFHQNPFKLELIVGREETLSAYRQGEFIDLCTGPHIPHFGLVQGFKVLKTSGAYWRGDSQNEQLTRIYGISFPEKKLLADYLHRVEEARKRDHRVLGKRLNLFSFHEDSPGMPFFHPRGMVVWNELVGFLRALQQKHGYLEIKTPVMLSRELWEKSGHWENYRDNMYTSEIEEKQFAIKPMNCPGCLLYYKDGQYSYRQLPLRVAEIGHVHRHELSGALSGLFRVRSFHQDDAHIFMRPEDIKDEILAVLDLADQIYQAFGLQYHLELSTRPEKSIGSDEQWELAIGGLTAALSANLEANGRNYVINEGDGAFYGPKIDFHIRDAIGRTWQCGTIQLDMALPERFELSYSTASGNKERPVMVHRAIYGSIERFFAILLEHFAGRFPLWLSPLQVRLLSVADRHTDFAYQLLSEFQAAGLRGDVDDSAESISKKVRIAQIDQVNYILVIGDKELENKKLSIRTRSGKVSTQKTPKQLILALQKERDCHSLHSLLEEEG